MPRHSIRSLIHFRLIHLNMGLPSMADRFNACLVETLKWEGGYSNDPYDPGGATMRGIIQRVYDGFRDARKLPRQDVRKISHDELVTIYRANYWNLIRGDELAAGFDQEIFDFCVNSGPKQAVVSMQRVLGIPIDGHFGAVTMAALQRVSPEKFITDYMNERRRFLKNLKTFWRFGKGWLSRCDGIEAAATAAVSGPGNSVFYSATAPVPDPDPTIQSESQGRASAPDPKPPMAAEASVGGAGGGQLIMAAPNIISKAAAKGAVTFYSLLIAILTEPLFWTGVVTLGGALSVFLWRRRHAH